MALRLADRLDTLPGIGPARARGLEKLGLVTVEDLLRCYPRSYEDRRKFSTVAAAPVDIPVCLELLEPLFRSLSAKNRSILGHTFGVYGYEKLSADELGLRELLSPDGVTKARKTALEHLRKRYPGSELQRWREAFRSLNRARREAGNESVCLPYPAWWGFKTAKDKIFRK